MNTIDVDPQTDSIWGNLIRRHKSDVFHSPEWYCVLAETYGFQPHAQVLMDEAGAPKAGIAYCRIEDMMDPRIVSLPFSDFCDPLVNDQDEWDFLVNQLVNESNPIKLRCLHNRVPLHDERFKLVNKAKWHSLDLQPDLDTIFEGLESSARRAIRKAQREGVTVHIASGKEMLRTFFELHLRTRKVKYLLLAQPYRFFERIWEHFLLREQGALMVAACGSKIVSSVLFLHWQDKLYYKFSASDYEYVKHRPNDLIIWEAIKYGKALGCSYLDFGLSDWDQEGLLRYKRKFATEEKTISFLQYTPPGISSGQTKQVQQLLPQLTSLFTDKSVPDHITEKAGETLYRFFT